MEEDMKELAIFPNSITVPELGDQNSWNYTQSVTKCQNLFKTVRDGGVELVLEFLTAHELLVNKKIPGKTWGGFCKEVGVGHATPYGWFQKWNLPYSRTGLPRPSLLINSVLPNPLKSFTKPETKIKLEEIVEERSW